MVSEWHLVSIRKVQWPVKSSGEWLERAARSGYLRERFESWTQAAVHRSAGPGLKPRKLLLGAFFPRAEARGFHKKGLLWLGGFRRAPTQLGGFQTRPYESP